MNSRPKFAFDPGVEIQIAGIPSLAWGDIERRLASICYGATAFLAQDPRIG
jgi:hypothetical protein